MKFLKISQWKDTTKILIFRIWMAGAVCLFIGMTPIGGGETESVYYVYQLIVTLAIGIFLTDILIINPVTRLMFNIEDSKQRLTWPLYLRVASNIIYFVYLILLITAVSYMYWGVNALFTILGLTGANSTGFVKLEPISFSLFYGLLYYITMKIYQIIKSKFFTKNNKIDSNN